MYLLLPPAEESIDNPFRYSSVSEDDYGHPGVHIPVSTQLWRWLNNARVRAIVLVIQMLIWIRDKVEREVFKVKKNKVQSSADITRRIHFNRPELNVGFPNNYIRWAGRCSNNGHCH